MKKDLFTIAVIAMIAVTAIVTVLIITLDGGETASVILPSAPAAHENVSALPDGNFAPQGVAVITPQNVQAVIASLEHSTDYFAQMTTLLTASNGTHESLVSMWVRGDMTRTIVTEIDMVKNILTDGNEYWIWYSDDAEAVFHGTAGSRSAALAEALNGLPDYTAVLVLDPADITEAGYVQRDGGSCIRAVVSGSDGSESEYLISVADGLLAGYTRYENDAEVFSLRNEYTQLSPSDDSVFRLP